MKKEKQQEMEAQKVLIYPAMTPEIDGKRIYFLFSIHQIEDIQGELKIVEVPFAVPFTEGLAVWRDNAVPVISLERYLGMQTIASNKGQRYIILRSAVTTQEGITETRCAIRTEREIKMVPIPESHPSVSPNGWVDHDLIKGVFEWNDGLIIVPETEFLFQETGFDTKKERPSAAQTQMNV